MIHITCKENSNVKPQWMTLTTSLISVWHSVYATLLLYRDQKVFHMSSVWLFSDIFQSITRLFFFYSFSPIFFLLFLLFILLFFLYIPFLLFSLCALLFSLLKPWPIIFTHTAWMPLKTVLCFNSNFVDFSCLELCIICLSIRILS